MGQMHFDVPDSASDFFAAARWREAYLCGIEGVPWQTQNRFDGRRFTLTRSVDTSAKLLITCPVPTIGYRLLTSCSLRCEPKAHRLLVELARGSCFRVRVQSDIWRRGGLTLSDAFDDLLARGTERFIDATQTADADRAAEIATEAIEFLEKSATKLGELFTAQSIAFRKSREHRLSTMLAVSVLPPSPWKEMSEELGAAANPHSTDTFSGPASGQTSGPASDLATGSEGTPTASSGSGGQIHDTQAETDGPVSLGRAFNAAAVRISWGDIESASGRFEFDAVSEALDACARQGIRVIGGPLVDYHPRLLPDWLTLFDDNFDRLAATMNDFVEKTVMQFRGRVHLWNAASGFNTAGPLGLIDEQVMRLSIGAIQTVRRCDPNTPVILSLDQPCGEYLARDQDGISPFHFADALLRSGLGLAGIGLNFRFGYSSGETQPRSAIDFAQLIDRWSTLNAPLMVQVSVAGAPGQDADALVRTSPEPLKPDVESDKAAWSELQYQFAKPLIDTLLSKQIVHAVVWDGWSDRQPHLLPHSGLVDPSGRPRPMLDYLCRVRAEMLL